MRISDWSSDVCSSDLLQLYGPITARLRIGIVVVAQKRGKNGFAINAGQASPDHPALPIDKGGGLAIADGPEIKLGRASGRERVCQYGSISVVAGALTKKKPRTYDQHQDPSNRE